MEYVESLKKYNSWNGEIVKHLIPKVGFVCLLMKFN